jgi:hypothetical protein
MAGVKTMRETIGALWEESAIYRQHLEEQRDAYRQYREHDALDRQQRYMHQKRYQELWLGKQWISYSDLVTAVDKLNDDPMRLPPGF